MAYLFDDSYSSSNTPYDGFKFVLNSFLFFLLLDFGLIFFI